MPSLRSRVAPKAHQKGNAGRDAVPLLKSQAETRFLQESIIPFAQGSISKLRASSGLPHF